MNIDGAKAFLKQHWVLIAGSLAGVYLVLHYVGGSSAAATSTNPTAAITAANTAAAASNAQTALASQQLSDQSLAASQANQVANTQAIGQSIGQIGQAIGTVIAAQSVIPAQAINAASVNNQTALVSAAQVAASGIGALPSSLQAATSLVTASYTPLAVYGQTLIGLNDHIGSLGEAAVNAVGQSVSSSANSAATSAAASAQANAAASAAAAGAVSSVAKAAVVA